MHLRKPQRDQKQICFQGEDTLIHSSPHMHMSGLGAVFALEAVIEVARSAVSRCVDHTKRPVRSFFSRSATSIESQSGGELPLVEVCSPL